MLDVVARQHDDRTLAAEIEREQRRRDALDRVERIGVGELPPGTVAVALREEHAVGRLARPAAEAVAETAGKRRQRLGGTDEEGAVGAGGDARSQSSKHGKRQFVVCADRPHCVLPLFAGAARRHGAGDK